MINPDYFLDVINGYWRTTRPAVPCAVRLDGPKEHSGEVAGSNGRDQVGPRMGIAQQKRGQFTNLHEDICIYIYIFILLLSLLLLLKYRYTVIVY